MPLTKAEQVALAVACGECEKVSCLKGADGGRRGQLELRRVAGEAGEGRKDASQPNRTDLAYADAKQWGYQRVQCSAGVGVGAVQAQTQAQAQMQFGYPSKASVHSSARKDARRDGRGEPGDE